METLFGINDAKIKKALMHGIKVKNNNGIFIEVQGIISLVYIPQFAKFVLCYGTNAVDAKYVLVENFGKDWMLK